MEFNCVVTEDVDEVVATFSSCSSSSISDVDEAKELETVANREKIEWLSKQFCNIGHRILTMMPENVEDASKVDETKIFKDFVAELSSMSFKMAEDVQPISSVYDICSSPAFTFWKDAAVGTFEERWKFHDYWIEKMNMTDEQRCKWFELVEHVQRLHYPIVQRIIILHAFLDYVKNVFLDAACRDAMHWVDMNEYPKREIDADGNPYE